MGAYHVPGRFGICRIVIAPCAPFNVSEDLMRGSVEFARARLTLHTHVAETLDERAYCIERTGLRPWPTWIGSAVSGRVLIEKGQLLGVHEQAVVAEHNAIARSLGQAVL